MGEQARERPGAVVAQTPGAELTPVPARGGDPLEDAGGCGRGGCRTLRGNAGPETAAAAGEGAALEEPAGTAGRGRTRTRTTERDRGRGRSPRRRPCRHRARSARRHGSAEAYQRSGRPPRPASPGRCGRPENARTHRGNAPRSRRGRGTRWGRPDHRKRRGSGDRSGEPNTRLSVPEPCQGRAPDDVVALRRHGIGDEDAAERPAPGRPGGGSGEGRGAGRRCHGARRMSGAADEERHDEHAGEASGRKPRGGAEPPPEKAHNGNPCA